VNGARGLRADRARFVDRFADHVDDAAQRFIADRHEDRRSGVRHILAADETFRRVHSDRANGVFAQMLRNLEHEALPAVLRFQRVQDGRQVTVELNVDDSAHDLTDLTNFVRSH
jgi:hypothetical protein